VYVTRVVGDNRSQVVEVKAYTPTEGSIQWLVTDHLGTPRLIVDQTGAWSSVKRHDYLPFGEELFAGTGGRTTSQGYSTGDGIRQQFTAKERDVETGLDYFGARYYSTLLGRFTSVDPVFMSDDRVLDPQQLNLCVYTRNDPLNLIDPTGETIDFEKDNNGKLTKNGQESQEHYQKYKKFLNKNPIKYAAQLATLKQLEKSNVNYVVNVTSKELDGSHEAEGSTSTDGTNVLVTIRNIGGPQGEKFSMEGRFAHEFEHARQFDDGEFCFVRTGSGKWVPDPTTYDLYDEVRAFNAQLGVTPPTQDTPMLRTLRDDRLTDAQRADQLKSSYRARSSRDRNVTFLLNEPKGTLVRPNATHPDVFGRVHK
jgi:RHS repeat-associated protein